MDASELLKRYAAGERDFSDAKLKGADLHGANLEGVKLSGASIVNAYCRNGTASELKKRVTLEHYRF